MKKLTKVLIFIPIFLIAVVIVMWVFKISPPPGPWPMPPWYEGTISDGLETTPWKQPQENLDMVSGSEFLDTASVAKIATGHTFMDIYNTYLFQNHLISTINSMQQNNASWVVYDNYNSYHQMNPPLIGSYPNPSPKTFRDALDEELETMIKTAHDKGLKFALMSELNYDVAKGPFTTWEENQTFWESSVAILTQMGENLDQPTNQQNTYWDQWFVQYTKFILSNAVAAQNYGADMLIIGKQIEGAVQQGNTARWEKLIRQVREVYTGPISYAAWTSNEYTQLADAGFLSSLDYITIYMYNPIADSKNPSVAELKESFETILDRQAEYYYQKTGKKIVLLTPFQSRDFGANQEWFEPAAPAPDIQRDDLIQAKMYEALFQAIADEEYIEAVWTWGYWWLEDDFKREDGGEAGFDKSSSVRNKPAAEVIRKWSK